MTWKEYPVWPVKELSNVISTKFDSFLLELSSFGESPEFEQTTYLSHNKAPSVTCCFLENSEVSQIQNKDVAEAAAAASAAVWPTHTHTHTSSILCCFEPRSSLKVLSRLMRATFIRGSAAAAVWWVATPLLYFHVERISFHFDTRARFEKLVSGWHRVQAGNVSPNPV